MNIRKYASLGLAVALQVLPLTRVFVATTPAMGSSYAIIATWIAGVAALMGGIDSVSGQSTRITSATTATATNGVAFSYRITTGPDAANRFAAAPLPAGLVVSTTTGRITGTPTTTGVYVIGLTASDNGQANRTVTANLTLTIIAGGGGGGTAPTITTQPTSQTVTAGGNASFTVAASGTAPLTYQWRRNGTNLVGSTSATLSLTSVTTNQAGSYTCVVSNSVGSATSSAATLTVNPAVIAPTITTQPTSQTVTAGANVNFIVAASGTSPLSYQWRLNGAIISGATSATLTLNSVTVGQSGGIYTCFVTNSAGNATSGAATLTVNPAPVAPAISTHPTSQTVTAGANVNFTVAASGTAPLSYQWRLNGANISGATSATLTLNSVTVGQSGGSYTCFVTNSAGNATSSAATLTVNPAVIAPTITTQPANQSVTAGNNASFTVVASGTAPLGYQWRLNGANISGATSATLALTAVTLGQSGGSYSCVVTNVAGTATSSAATLTVTAAAVAPTITTQPVNQTVTAGNNASFTVVASGTAPLSYQWRLNGANIGGATSATLTLTGVTVGQSGGSYSCVVTNIAGNATSSAATLTVNPAPIAPTITTQPVSRTVTAGTNVSFTVAATGTAPLSYQWRLNGADIGGATSTTLTLTSVTTGQSGGSYSCFVSNAAGTATSSAAVLTVNPAPVAPAITTQPSSQTVTAGNNVSFTVTASGTAPLSYQWRLNGSNIGGATSPTLTLTSVTTGQSGGSYSCFVSNAAGTATSSAATLTVNAAPVAPNITTQPMSRTVIAGTNVSFTVVASGTSPFSYQWRLNGANIAGAASATLTLTSVMTGQSGNYSCVVTNAGGTATSSAATLTVNPATSQPTTLTLIIQGQGTVSPDLSSANLNIGQLYRVTATPAAGYIFAGWTVQSPSTVPTSRTIAFVMASNLVLQATFAPDPNIMAAGVYNGLFHESDEVRLHSAGQFNFSSDRSGNYAAWIQIGANRYPFSGTLDTNLNTTVTIPRSGFAPLTVTLHVGQASEAGQIVGQVTDGSWISNLSGGRKSAVTSAFAGDYTLVIPGSSVDSSLPAGDGFATLHVANDGLASLSGTLADGTRFTHSAFVTEDGDWPLYSSIYSSKGALVSWLTFSNLPSSDLNGTLVWIKQANASAISYPLGFTNFPTVVGSIYVPPDVGGKAVNLASASLSFRGGTLGNGFTNAISFNAGSQIVNLSPNEMATTIQTSTGCFVGQVREPSNGKLHMFSGVILQKQNIGFGTMINFPAVSRVVLSTR